MTDIMDTADNLRVNVNPSLFAPSLRDATDIGPLYREAVTNGFPVITTDHAFIHEGIAYTLSGTATVSGSWSLSFTTPATGYIHFKPAGISAAGGPVVVTLLEGPTFTGGSDATPRNRNRVISSPDSSTVACKTGVTPSGGTVINTLFIPGATSGSQKVGASTEAAEELVLDQATVYVLTLTETATGDVVCGYDLFWYEEEGA